MALPSSGPISIQDIVNEFGGSGSHSLSEYYRGGAFVPDTPTNSNIPTSGTISLADFYGATNVVYFVLGGTWEDLNPIGGGAGLTLTYGTNGGLSLTGQVGGSLFNGAWKTGDSFAGEYIRCDVSSGSFSSGTTGSDIILSSNRTWTLTLPGSGDSTVIATFTIKDGFGGNVLAQDTITLRVGSV